MSSLIRIFFKIFLWEVTKMTMMTKTMNFEGIKKYLLEKGYDFTGDVGHNYGKDEQIIVIDTNLEGIGMVDGTIIVNNTDKSFRVDELYHLKLDDKERYFRAEEVEDPDGKIQREFLDMLILKALNIPA